MKSLVFSLLLGSAALALASPSRAQADLSTEAASVRTDYRKALAEMDKGNWQNARVLLIDLFKRSPTFDVAASLGEAEAKLGESAKAAQHFAFALKNVPPKEKAETSARIRAGLNSVTGNVATVQLSVNREDAQIFVDGEQVGSYPALKEVYLNPGKHTVEARSNNESAKRDVQATAATSHSLALELAPSSPPVASGLSAQKPSHHEEPLPTQAPPDESDSPVHGIVLVAGGSLAVAGLAMGIGFGVASNSAEDDADKYRASLGDRSACSELEKSADCRALHDAVSRQSRDRTIANVGWALGSLGAVAVGVALLWPSHHDDRKRTTARGLSLGWQGDRFLLRGTF